VTGSGLLIPKVWPYKKDRIEDYMLEGAYPEVNQKLKHKENPFP
jgi:hypothetical protein